MGTSTARARVRLTLDHHFSRRLAVALRDRGADVVAAGERDWHLCEDEVLLERSAQDGRALLTGDLGDFIPIALRWTADGRAHSGLVLAPGATWPTHRDSIGLLVAALANLMLANPDDDALADRVVWLQPPRS